MICLNSIRNVDKGDRATAEQVLDNRTRLILFKMQNQNLFSEINGCVSTGKEVIMTISIIIAFIH